MNSLELWSASFNRSLNSPRLITVTNTITIHLAFCIHSKKTFDPLSSCLRSTYRCSSSTSYVQLPFPSESTLRRKPNGNMVSPASSWKEAEENVLSCTAQIMNQAAKILRSGAINDKALTFESKIMAGSTPGKHFRHVLDHLRILLDAIEDWQSHTYSSSSSSSSADLLRVDYDSRIASKLPQTDTSVSACLEQFEETTKRLYQLFEGSDGSLYSQSLRLCATTPFVVEMDSTVGRELWFCGLHAIHHYALARVILVKELGLEKGIDDQFGVAPSTLVHREWRKESNRADAAYDTLAQGKKDDLPSTSGGSRRHNGSSHQQSRHMQPRRQARSKL